MKHKIPLHETRQLLGLMSLLRHQCPWDKKQTHQSLIPYLLEETHEVLEAIERKNSNQLLEELGDLLFQIMFHAQIAHEKGKFDFDQVAGAIRQKMIARHAHLFGDKKISGLEGHLKNWAQRKAEEKPGESILEGIPKTLPALRRAQRYNAIAASIGFDWSGVNQVFSKVEEELKELMAEIRHKPKRKMTIEMELGDLLFAITSLSRHLGLDAEGALRKSSEKFLRRFHSMELEAKRKGRPIHEYRLQELESFYQAAKKAEKRNALH